MIGFENISISFGGKQAGRAPVLRGVDFRVDEGEFVCLLGPSGCGKSTLLNLAAGFFPPDSGRVLFDGVPVSGPGPERGMVFQEPTLFPWLTVFGNVAFGLRGRGLNRDEIRARVEQTLQLVGLQGVNSQYPHTLSGGMRQRVALARVWVLEPDALLLDEPFSSLDANSRESLQDELLRIWRARRRTTLFVTHSVSEAVYLADRVVLMAPSPASIQSELSVTVSRPRERTSESLRELEAELRKQLDALIPHQAATENARCPDAAFAV